MKQQSPMLRLWELSEKYHGGLLRAILSASVGVLCGMLPYFAAAQIIIGRLGGNTDIAFDISWCLAALAGYFVRTALFALALSRSDNATFARL